MFLEINNNPKSLHLPRIAQSLAYTCGAACFASMFQYFRGYSPGELSFAKELETFDLGYTPPINIVNLARSYGFLSELEEGATLQDIISPWSQEEVIFVTWWCEDAGHYSLIKYIDTHSVILMDPLLAEKELDTSFSLDVFLKHWASRGSKLIRCRES